MFFVNGVFTLLSVILFVCLIAALFKPSIFKIRTRLKAFLTFFIAMMLSTIIVGATSLDEVKTQIAEENKLLEQKSEVKKQSETLGQELAAQQRVSGNQAKIQDTELAQLKTLMERAHLSAAENITHAEIKPIALVLSDGITGVERSRMHTSKILDVFLPNQNIIWNDANILSIAAGTAEKVFKGLREQSVKGLNNVRFHVKTAVVDQYNNQGEEVVFTINYDYSEVSKMNMENTQFYQNYLTFAQFESNAKIGRDVFNAWCADSSNRKLSGDFCFQ